MCGFAGFIKNNHSSLEFSDLKKMLDAIKHRGPDDEGMWQGGGNVYLGHRRLAIHDLSKAGYQPMHSNSGRYTIVFNGEIYNFEEIKSSLPLVSWRGSSDTEVMLHAIEIWGIEISLRQFNGMFSFALWDSLEETLTLAVDRFGEKPLYYGLLNGVFCFASEITSIESLFGDYLKIDRLALLKQSAFSYIPAPLSIYRQVKKLQPGSFIQYKGGSLSQIKQFFSMKDLILNSKERLFTSEYEAVEQLHDVLKHSVKLRMASDVPLGAFLSGGVDSSLVVALMQNQSTVPINTFSIGFDVPGYNEAEFAKQVASFLGTNHHERYFSQDDLLQVVPKLGAMFDEPFSDASQMPMYLVSAMAKEKVTVALSGDGGDELFSGYKRYSATTAIWSRLSTIPCKKYLAGSIRHSPVWLLNALGFPLAKVASSYGRAGRVGPKLKTLAEWLGANSIEDFYKLSIIHWKEKDNLLINIDPEGIFSNDNENPTSTFGEWMMYFDSINYLPGDILTKVDRTAMSVSLEGRIPLLDPNVVETAWRMPLELKQKGSIGKWPLKEVLYKYLPKEMMERPKMGFGVPIHEWLRGPLKEWSQDLLSYERLKIQNVYNPAVVQSALTKHLKNEENNAAKLWDILMVQAWFDSDRKREGRI